MTESKAITFKDVVPNLIKRIEEEQEINWNLLLANYCVCFQFKFNSYLYSVLPSDDTLFQLSSVDYKKQQKELHKLLTNTEEPTIESFAKAKYLYDQIFLQMTKRGTLKYTYKEDSLLTAKRLQEMLNVSPYTLSKYVQSGMQTCSEYESVKYPPENVFYGKSSLWRSRIEDLNNKFIKRNEEINDTISLLSIEIRNFQSYYGKSLNEQFPNVDEIKEQEEKDDYYLWKAAIDDLEEIRKQPE